MLASDWVGGGLVVRGGVVVPLADANGADDVVRGGVVVGRGVAGNVTKMDTWVVVSDGVVGECAVDIEGRVVLDTFFPLGGENLRLFLLNLFL